MGMEGKRILVVFLFIVFGSVFFGLYLQFEDLIYGLERGSWKKMYRRTCFWISLILTFWFW